MQGFNMGRYVPPDKEGLTTGNALHSKRTVPSTIRFELPFAVWCEHCPKPTIIGQGVRFNATKTKVGNYHSTSIWAFRFKHNVCGGEIEVRTDPAKTEYVVTKGGKRRDTGEGKGEEETKGGVKILTDGEREELRKSAFKRLEKTIEDREAAKKGEERIEGLREAMDKGWGDPYERNRRLRAEFRRGRKEREKEAEGVAGLRKRLGLGDEDEEDGGLKILQGTREDELRAGLVDFRPLSEEDGGEKALARPLFGGSNDSNKSKKEKQKGVTKVEAAAAKRRGDLVERIAGNTRAGKDPFLNGGVREKVALGVKRKRGKVGKAEKVEEKMSSKSSAAGLVDYDSD